MDKTIYTPNMMSKAVILMLSAVQAISLALGWISYALGSITASLFTWLSFLSLLWYPLDWLNKRLWMGCDVLKQKLMGQRADWSRSSRRWEGHFPAF